ncbi:MAG TPA: DUF58 domain-containing protein [Thermoplasmata archaeon]|nr:DUF58 domain-containing protein [Thermoplasmata archaeon]
MALRWRSATAVAIGLGGSAVVLGFFARSPAALLFAVPLFLGPLAAYGLRPAESSAVRVSSRLEGSREPVLLRMDLTLEPSHRGSLETAVTVRPPLRLLPPGPVERVTAGSGSTVVRFPLTSAWPTVARIDPPEVAWRDPLGFASSELTVHGSGARYERPPAGARHLATLMVQRLSRNVGVHRAPLPSPQGEFQSVRPFTPGDGLRQINWRATARQATLVSNSFLAEVPPEIVLALDVGPWGLPPEDEDVVLGVIRAAAYALAGQLSRLKTRLGVALLEPFPRWVALGTGRAHLREIQELISDARPGPERPPVERYAFSLQRAYPPRTTVLLFSPFVEETMLAIGYHLRRSGLSSFIIAASPLTIARARTSGTPEAVSLGFRLLRLTRARELGHAWEWGPVVDWEELSSLGALTALFRRPVGPGGAGRG